LILSILFENCFQNEVLEKYPISQKDHVFSNN